MTTSPTIVLLVLLCALSFSGADMLRKLLAGTIRPVPLLFALAAGMAPPFVVWFLRQGSPTPTAAYWLPGLGSMLINVGANLAFLEAVRRSPLSLTIPLLSLTPVFTAILAVPLLGEIPGSRQWLGIGAVVTGTFWLNLGGESRSMQNAWRAFMREPGSRLMVLVSLLWSLAMPLDKIAVSEAGAAFHGMILGIGVALALVVLAALRGTLGEFRDLRHRPGWLAAGVVLSVVALALQLLAIRLVWVGFVETMKRGVGSLLALVWGWLIFGEPLAAHRFVAVALMGLGVALILL